MEWCVIYGGQIATSAAYSCDYELLLYMHVLLYIHAYVGSLNVLLLLFTSILWVIVRIVYVVNKNANHGYFLFLLIATKLRFKA